MFSLTQLHFIAILIPLFTCSHALHTVSPSLSLVHPGYISLIHRIASYLNTNQTCKISAENNWHSQVTSFPTYQPHFFPLSLLSILSNSNLNVHILISDWVDTNLSLSFAAWINCTHFSLLTLYSGKNLFCSVWLLSRKAGKD